MLINLKFGLFPIAKLLLGSFQTRLLHNIDSLPVEQGEDALLVNAVTLPITRHLPVNAADLFDRRLIYLPEGHPLR